MLVWRGDSFPPGLLGRRDAGRGGPSLSQGGAPPQHPFSRLSVPPPPVLSLPFGAPCPLAASGGALGIVVTRAPADGVWEGALAGCGWATVWTSPRDLRTSASSLAMVSLLSLRNCRAFSRPWPMRSPL